MDSLSPRDPASATIPHGAPLPWPSDLLPEFQAFDADALPTTPDALERVLTTARKITSGRLGVVFGCGGDRDRTKRPIMGEIAARLADRAWITSDNPRSEDPDAIIAEIAAGVARVWRERERYARLADRHVAIASALAWARPGDTLVIAGKGHETYQIVGTDVLPFDDREVARRLLSERAR